MYTIYLLQWNTECVYNLFIAVEYRMCIQFVYCSGIQNVYTIYLLQWNTECVYNLFNAVEYRMCIQFIYCSRIQNVYIIYLLQWNTECVYNFLHLVHTYSCYYYHRCGSNRQPSYRYDMFTVERSSSNGSNEARHVISNNVAF